MRLTKTSLIAGSATLIFAGAAIAAPPVQKTVKASRITRYPKTLAPGAKVKPSQLLGARVFVDAGHGVALAGLGQAQYEAATSDGGRTWRTDSPALHVDAAQAPLAVGYVGAVSRRTSFAYGSQAADVTSDGGQIWYRALFDGLVVAIVRNAEGHLVAFVDGSATGSSQGSTAQYVSKDGGRSWHYDTTVGGS
jgi:hypothetical protein